MSTDHPSALPEISEAQPEPKSASARIHKWWPWLLAVGLLSFGLILWSLDEQPPDVSDLKFEPLVLRPEENGFQLFAQAAFAAQKAVPSTDDDTDENRDSLEDMLAGERWDEARVTEWMTALEPVWPLLEKASNATHAQPNQLKELSDPIPEVGPMRKLVSLAALKTKYDLQENRPADAVQTALSLLRYCLLLQNSRGSLISYLITIGSKSIVLKSIEDIARDPRVTPDQLHKLLTEIEAARESGEGLRYAMRSEIYMMISAQRLVAKSGLQGFDEDPLKSVPILSGSRIPGLYKPNKTLRIYVKSLRSALDATGSHSSLAAYNSSKPAAAFTQPGLARFNPDNIYGRMLLRVTAPSWGSIMRTHLNDQSRVSATQAFIALHLYKREHGQFPANLDALVPTYLPAVPKDCLDDAPIRYSAELGVVWSIGKNNLNITSADQNTDREIALWLVPRKPKPAPEAATNGVTDGAPETP